MTSQRKGVGAQGQGMRVRTGVMVPEGLSSRRVAGRDKKRGFAVRRLQKS